MIIRVMVAAVAFTMGLAFLGAIRTQDAPVFGSDPSAVGVSGGDATSGGTLAATAIEYGLIAAS